MADKRIRQLQSGTLELTDVFAFDNDSLLEAEKASVQDLVDIIQENISTSIIVFGGSDNPDNTLGNDGDIYFKTLTTSLTIYQKVAGAWTVKATFTPEASGGSSALTFTEEVDSNGNVDLSGLDDMPVVGTIPSALRCYHGIDFDEDNSQNTSYTPSTQKVSVGLEEGTEVTIKITF